jgi:hypothetical protein
MLTCTRADGSETAHAVDGRLPLHDLTHYAVESVLKLRRAFFGLVADGWDLGDFENEARKRALPAETYAAELIVGFFDLERASGVVGATAEELNWRIDHYQAHGTIPATSVRLTDTQVVRIRSMCSDLYSRWASLREGESLDITVEV